MEILREVIAQLRGQGSIFPSLQEVLAPLEAYDARHGTDLVNTLSVYVKTGGNITTTADTLFLHRNSVAYRLLRIQELSGLKLRDTQIRSLLLAALALTDPEFLQPSEPVAGRNSHEGKREK